MYRTKCGTSCRRQGNKEKVWVSHTETERTGRLEGDMSAVLLGTGTGLVTQRQNVQDKVWDVLQETRRKSGLVTQRENVQEWDISAVLLETRTERQGHGLG
ncbi:hypothetical protein WMY93_034054 [Mugilogobius chulae]|uniref:Uncharacterized protein n=1 Tax=Mugilogobius chulae TaxID=88201 RepID=A0AAW0MIX4_9GOBI